MLKSNRLHTRMAESRASCRDCCKANSWVPVRRLSAVGSCTLHLCLPRCSQRLAHAPVAALPPVGVRAGGAAVPHRTAGAAGGQWQRPRVDGELVSVGSKTARPRLNHAWHRTAYPPTHLQQAGRRARLPPPWSWHRPRPLVPAPTCAVPTWAARAGWLQGRAWAVRSAGGWEAVLCHACCALWMWSPQLGDLLVSAQLGQPARPQRCCQASGTFCLLPPRGCARAASISPPAAGGG